MPLAKNRVQNTISIPADKHLAKIVKALKAKGQATNKTAWLSNLILSQPVPNGKKPTEALPTYHPKTEPEV